MEERATETRKTRFVCISDTHNATANGSFKLPKGDVLIHAGDLTNQGSFAELQKTVRWIEDSDFESKIVVAGNHDVTLDATFYDQYGLNFHNQDPQDVDRCQKLLAESPSIRYLQHETAVVSLSAPEGPRTTFKIFGSPYSPTFGLWAFGYSPTEAPHMWDGIPLDSDVVVTHTPPKYHCDERNDRRAVGCEALRCMLWRVRPRLAICGHIHEGRGAEVIKWDLGVSNIKYKEAGVERWTEPGKDNKKMSLIDLTRKGGRPIENDGSAGDGTLDAVEELQYAESSSPKVVEPNRRSLTSLQQPRGGLASSTVAEGPEVSATRGQGGIPPSSRCDLEALSGRLGRRETWVINAAIMASSWPHSSGGGKKFNKPIVVDIDLPIATGQ